MPSSGSGRLISGSWTVASAAFTASSAGDPVSVSDMRDESPSTGNPGAGLPPAGSRARGRLSLYGGGAVPLPGAGVSQGMSVALTRVWAVSTSARSATLRDAIGLGAAVGLYGVAFGAAAAGAGLSTWQALAMSALMFTGASQFAFVGVLGAGGGA